jgi:hypothetical protein
MLPTSDATRWRILFAITVLTIIGVGIPFLTRHHSEWDDVYRAAGRRLLAGESLYPINTSYAYPPLTAALVAPLADAPTALARAVWYAINVAFIGGLIVCAWRITQTTTMVREPTVFWLGLAIGLPFVLHALSHQKIDAIVTAIVIGGCFALTRQRPFVAAICFGLAAAVKCTPLLFAPYLLLKGRPAAALLVLIVAVSANLLPDAIVRPTDATCHLEKWFQFYIAPMLKPDYTPGVWASEIVYNQSLMGAANRWTSTTWHITDKVAIEAMPPLMPTAELKRLQYGVFAGIASIALAAMIRGRRRSQAIAWECGLVISAMLLLSPMSSVPHFATLLLPGWLLTRAVVIEQRWELLPFLGGMFLGAMSSNKDLLGANLYTLSLWYGSVMSTAIFAFAGCIVAMMLPQANKVVHVLPYPQVEPARRAA